MSYCYNTSKAGAFFQDSLTTPPITATLAAIGPKQALRDKLNIWKIRDFMPFGVAFIASGNPEHRESW
jgi:hypothetical protein